MALATVLGGYALYRSGQAPVRSAADPSAGSFAPLHGREMVLGRLPAIPRSIEAGAVKNSAFARPTFPMTLTLAAAGLPEGCRVVVVDGTYRRILADLPARPGTLECGALPVGPHTAYVTMNPRRPELHYLARFPLQVGEVISATTLTAAAQDVALVLAKDVSRGTPAPQLALLTRDDDRDWRCDPRQQDGRLISDRGTITYHNLGAGDYTLTLEDKTRFSFSVPGPTAHTIRVPAR